MSRKMPKVFYLSRNNSMFLDIFYFQGGNKNDKRRNYEEIV